MRALATLALFTIGMTVIGVNAGWPVACGVFVLIWGHQVEKHNP